MILDTKLMEKKLGTHTLQAELHKSDGNKEDGMRELVLREEMTQFVDDMKKEFMKGQ